MTTGNKRVRIDTHIETYLRSHSVRILDKPSDNLSAAELAIIANTLLMEHKQAQKMIQAIAHRIPLGSLANWIGNFGGNKALNQSTEVSTVSTTEDAKDTEDFKFDINFATQFEE